MSMISLSNVKHVSFDFWNTLAVPNLEFSAARTRVIAEYYGIPEEDAKRIYTSVKNFSDTAAELTGFGTTRENVMKLLNAQMPKDKRLDDENLEILSGVIDDLFAAFPPTIPERLVHLVKALRSRGVTVNILSNTNFIRGETLNEVVLEPEFGENFFAFQMFSDEWDMAKPSEEFFVSMLRFARRAARAGEGCMTYEVLHIGDNDITDISGGNGVAVQTLKVADPHDLTVKLEKLLNESV